MPGSKSSLKKRKYFTIVPNYFNVQCNNFLNCPFISNIRIKKIVGQFYHIPGQIHPSHNLYILYRVFFSDARYSSRRRMFTFLTKYSGYKVVENNLQKLIFELLIQLIKNMKNNCPFSLLLFFHYTSVYAFIPYDTWRKEINTI